MSDQQETVWLPKDIIVLVPLLASSLAISWEVGRFIPTGGFWFFALSEHFLAAMVALPIALTIILLLIVVFAILGPLARRAVAGTSRRGNVTGFVITAVAMSANAAFDFYQSGTAIFSLYAFSLAVTLLLANEIWFQRRIASSLGLAAVFGMSITMSLASSADISRRELRNLDSTSNRLSVITTKSTGTIKAYVVMAGERGILLYSPEKKRFIFQKSDDVQSIDWPTLSDL
jgi:hypothetical protein